jgi:hypothetical protein
MGFLAGVLGEVNRREDAAERRQEFLATLLERRKTAIIPELMKRAEKRNETLSAARSRVATAVGLRMSQEAAAILEASGQLELELERLIDLNKKGELNKDNLKVISEKIVESTDPEKASAALKYVLQGDLNADVNDTLVNALWFAGSEEEFTEGLQAAYAGMASSAGTGPSIAAREYSTRGAQIYTPSERSSTQSTIARSLGARLGLQVTYDSNGNFVGFQGDNEGAAEEILNNVLDIYTEYRTDPEYMGDPMDIINPIGDNITVLTQKGYDLAEIAQNRTFDVDVPEKAKPPSGGTGDVVQEYTVNRGQNYTQEVIQDVFDQTLNGGLGQ